jgi:hypothetical protein
MRAAIIALASLVIATLLTFPLVRFAIYSRDLFFMAAVIAASRYAGAAAGLVASLDRFFSSIGFLTLPLCTGFQRGGSGASRCVLLR